MRAKLLSYFLFFLLQPAGSQVLFKTSPVDLQMIPRDKNNYGNFLISGTVEDSTIRSLRVTIRSNADSTFIYDKITPLKNAEFSISLSIPAVMNDYNLSLYSLDQNNQQKPEREIKQLVAGDYFIVTGQSNAAGAMETNPEGFLTDDLYMNSYCRTIGTMYQRAVSKDPPYNPEQDLEYHHASSMYFSSGMSGCVGTWPLRMMHAILKQTGIPLCIVNGAMGGSELAYHFASHTPSDPLRLEDTSLISAHPYDRIFRKLALNNAIAGVKAVFVYQGESDAALSKEEAENYTQRFARLRESWKLDYPGLEKIFVFQINLGCGGSNSSLVRDQQRKLTQEFADVVVMPTVGSIREDRSTDGCHYSVQGYEQLGENMAPAVLKHLYHVNLKDKDIMGPCITRIYYSKQTEICLEFDMDVTLQYFQFQQEGMVYLQDYFFREDGRRLKIKSLSATDNRIYLTTDETLETTKLTYLPDAFSKLSSPYSGPWILNKNNEKLGALSFFEFPVEPYPNTLWFNGEDSLMVYPNPVSDYLVIRIKGNIVPEKISVFNATGEMLLDLSGAWDEKHVIDMRFLEEGIYVLRIYSNAGVHTRKIIVKSKK